MIDNSGFKDKQGKALFIGDIVQFRLGKFAKKSAGPSLWQIKRTKKQVILVVPESEGTGGKAIRVSDEKYLSFFKRP